MTTAALPDTLFTTAGFAPTGGDHTTLDDRIVAILEDLALRGRARCLVCGGETEPSGQCRACGATLA
jgi:tRNA(Ile2) C34 agmatinyltransferase TiaS